MKKKMLMLVLAIVLSLSTVVSVFASDNPGPYIVKPKPIAVTPQSDNPGPY